MTPNRREWLPCWLVLLAASMLYLHSLGDAPVSFGGDEAKSGIQAHSLAMTGRDLSGRFMPLFVNVEDPLPDFRGNVWWQPFLIYFQALVLTVLPFAEWSVRLPSVILTLLNIALTYGIARRLFPGVIYPTIAAMMLALTPSHLMFGRMALDYVAPVTFVLLWLWCLVRFLESGTTGSALTTGLALGVGIYTHVVSWVFMPLCLLLTLVTMRRTPRPAAAACVGFAIPLLVLIPWVVRVPQTIPELIGTYRVNQGHLTFLQGVKDKLTYDNIQDKVSIYWNYFNPTMLFFVGGASFTQGTRQVGAFLLPFAVFIGVGIFVGLSRLTVPIMAVLVAGFLLSPLPATLRGESGVLARALVMLPFAVLLAAYGVAAMREHANAAIRAMAIVLLALMPVQYAGFVRDYFGEYQLRSAYWFDPVNFRGVVEYVLSRDAAERVPAVYLAADLDDAGSRWLFYLEKYKREDLWPRTQGFDQRQPEHFAKMPAGSLLVLYVNDAAVPELLKSGVCHLEATIMHVTGSPSAVILRKL